MNGNIKKHNKMRIIFVSVLLAAFVLLLSSVISFFVLFFTMVKRPAGGWPLPVPSGSRAEYADVLLSSQKWLEAQAAEDVYIQSFDGIKLHALVLPVGAAEKAQGTVICVHGIHGTSYFDFAGIYQFLHESHYNVLLVDQRAHGKSEGKYITFGVKERYDVQKWADFASSSFPDSPQWLMGVSMGCASVLMASSLPMAHNVRGYIADCGYTSPYDIIKLRMEKDYHLPAVLILPLSSIFIKKAAGFGLKECSTIDSMKENMLPVLFVHGNQDDYVPFYMSKENYECCRAQKTFLETHAGHAANFLCAPEQYKEALKQFFNSTK